MNPVLVRFSPPCKGLKQWLIYTEVVDSLSYVSVYRMSAEGLDPGRLEKYAGELPEHPSTIFQTESPNPIAVHDDATPELVVEEWVQAVASRDGSALAAITCGDSQLFSLGSFSHAKDWAEYQRFLFDVETTGIADVTGLRYGLQQADVAWQAKVIASGRLPRTSKNFSQVFQLSYIWGRWKVCDRDS